MQKHICGSRTRGMSANVSHQHLLSATGEDQMIPHPVRLMTAAALAAALAMAPAAQARDGRGHGGYRGHGGGNAAGAAIVGGLIGLGLGAAIASQGGYPAPPPAYYGPPPGYYAPPPPAVYYGY